MSGLPMVGAVVNFAAEVARRRMDPELLPGLAAQIPGGPFVRWLHGVSTPVDNQLRVVAGDLEAEDLGSWLKTLLTDNFYGSDHDLVVQTRSMYGGALRKTTPDFLLDRGKEVSHFNYFTNELTAKAVVAGLVQNEPAGFRPIGRESQRGQDSSGVRAPRSARSGAANREKSPLAVVLPGILGSELTRDGKWIWANPAALWAFDELGPNAKGVEASLPIQAVYQPLQDILRDAGNEVLPFAYDWRLSVTGAAEALATRLAATLRDGGRPVRFVAHSMGGLVVRALAALHPDLFRDAMSRDASRILMLGTPNDGSWAPMQVLTGDSFWGGVLSAVDAPWDPGKLRELAAQFPGFLLLQASLQQRGLHRAERWEALEDADFANLPSWWRPVRRWHRWGKPTQSVLDEAVRVQALLTGGLPAFLEYADKTAVVVGRGRRTPAGFLESRGGIDYETVTEGDGLVTHASSRLPGVETWSVGAAHVELPLYTQALPGYIALLDNGPDALEAPGLTPEGRTARRGSSVSRGRPSRDGTLFAGPTLLDAIAPPKVAGLSLRVVHTDLSFIQPALFVGHYRSPRLGGSEAILDRILGGALQDSRNLGLYPEAAKDHRIFLNTRAPRDNPLALPQPTSVIVVGLGDEGDLTYRGLVTTFRDALLGWALRLREEPDSPRTFEAAATLIGSGGLGITPGQSAQAIAEAAVEANDRLALTRGPTLTSLRLVELYQTRCVEAWAALQDFTSARDCAFEVAPQIEEGSGGLRQPLDARYRGTGYDLLRVQLSGDEKSLAYTLDGKRARSEVRKAELQLPLVRELVRVGASRDWADPTIGRTIFPLLVPEGLEPVLSATTNLVVEVDPATAGIPWEMLESPGATGVPWPIQARLIRKLATTVFRGTPRDAGVGASALIIGEPLADTHRFPRLPGARAEAAEVRDQLQAGERSISVTALIATPEKCPDAIDVISALMSQPWQIVHIAGHGVSGDAGSVGGVVLSGGLFLGAAEIRAMRRVPSLVFVNCCYLGASRAPDILSSSSIDRSSFAATVAQSLIEVGVRCVVAAGWAIDDNAARVFASNFYLRLMEGSRFQDAVADARQRTWEFEHQGGGNTWAAYQCYGDPDWSLVKKAEDLYSTPPVVASRAQLELQLDTLRVRLGQPGSGATKNDVRLLATTYGETWTQATTLEAFAAAFQAAGELEEAIRYYERARRTNSANVTLRGLEQLANLRVRHGWQAYREKVFTADQALASIEKGLEELTALSQVSWTSERASLIGSAFKRTAMVLIAQENLELAANALEKMHDAYREADKLSESPDSSHYAVMNRIGAALSRGMLAHEPAEALDALVQRARTAIQAASERAPDFFAAASAIELDLYVALSTGALHEAAPRLLARFESLHERVLATWLWKSVADQASFLLTLYESSMESSGSEAEAAASKSIRTVLSRYAESDKA
ncbi:MAG: CHAT domain-containing protein [Myxococcales bacterium]|nr:CHAT domain-containing protein [Myxococcales bacterium]